ncbi:glutathione peroxidase [Zoogloea sp. LCSB751]|uniref:glutathione peroxidase n=1 Tax=Zoogloea sp. LCSB751 TaxID=1965277 RepID=UPI001C1FC5DB|nr:glutathione peroxidase [Zoogloea sp. LCSB751]
MHGFEFRSLDGAAPVPLADFAGKVVLIVNTASRCGFTPQYAGLQQLHETYAGRGLVVLGFPCNQFGGQEPGDAGDIVQFCERNYGVSFPLNEKVDVNGANAHPLFRFLTAALPGVLGTQPIKWNFTKFLVDRQGVPFKRYAPTTTPADLEKDIEALLG